jgi:hypothetical protein
MFNQYLGYYFLNKGLLNHAQLCEVLTYEQSVKVKLGILAVNAKLMTAAQVEEIHHLQRMKDQKFGTLAISQGYLTLEQVDMLLDSQDKADLSLMQAIADKGYMTLAAVEKALADFRTEYSLDNSDMDTENIALKRMLDFSAAGDKADVLYHYVGLTLRNIVRFLNDTPYILAQPAAGVPALTCLISQQIKGEVVLLTRLSIEEGVLLELASRFCGEKLIVVDEMALDSAGEFLNVHNGVFCGALSDNGLHVDLEPQLVQQGDTFLDAGSYRIGIGTSFGQLELILSL